MIVKQRNNAISKIVTKYHHKLLHYKRELRAENLNEEQEPVTVTQTQAHVHLHKQKQKVLFQIVPIKLYEKHGRQINTWKEINHH